MAFTIRSTGDSYIQLEGFNMRTKIAKSGYTPVVGDLVILDTSAPNAVDLIAADENPYGIVETVLGTVCTVAELVAGATIELPYSGSVALGDKVEGDGAAATHGTSLDRSPVRHDNSNGVGLVIAVDADAPHGTGHCVVRFP